MAVPAIREMWIPLGIGIQVTEEPFGEKGETIAMLSARLVMCGERIVAFACHIRGVLGNSEGAGSFDGGTVRQTRYPDGWGRCVRWCAWWRLVPGNRSKVECLSIDGAGWMNHQRAWLEY